VSDPSASNPLNGYFSGGGFSDIFPVPEYQSEAVKHYLEKYPPPYDGKVYNNSKKARGFPDVSSLGLNLATVIHGQAVGIGGTSASAPTVAAIVTLLNELRIGAGKGPIGFLNSVFYANPDAFNDITIGGNPGCGTEGFQCQPGWDPITGLGTPNFEKLKDIFLSLP
jgi:tripeptidyl-peptidase-1